MPRRGQPQPQDDAPTGPLPRGDVSAEVPSDSGPGSELATLQAHNLWLNVDGRQVLADVSCSAQPGTLTAVVGPSAAARSGLVNILGGAMRPSFGTVTVGGYDPHSASARPHIGMVPQDDLLHRQLTVEQALGYLAELRLPPATSADDRRRAVDRVIRVVELAPVRTIQVGTLSREQRKRASVAAALITRPALLVLDEPTAGLEPAAQRRVMALLRRLADAGHTVVASTTAARLDECHQTVLLTAAGTTAFVGPPAEIATVLDTADWSQIYTTVAEDPDRAHQRFLARQNVTPEPPPAAAVEPLEAPARLSLARQIAVAARRQAWLIVGDQRYFVFLTLLPLLFGGLVLVVPGHAGLGQADPYGNSPDEGLEILAVLIFAAVVMGTALTIRDVFAERFLFRREQDNGLSPTAYLAAKIGVYSLVASVQTAIITTVAVTGKGAPGNGAVLLGSPALELYLAVLFTAVVSAIGALALSSLARYPEQLLLMAVLVILVSMILSGSAFPLAGRFLLEEISWLVPARWGFAAAASSVDLHAINALAHDDASWTHSAGWWLFDMAMLVAFGVAFTAFLRWRLRRVHEPEPVSRD
jgi:ABC-type multidrug transport system ATPase subunit